MCVYSCHNKHGGRVSIHVITNMEDVCLSCHNKHGGHVSIHVITNMEEVCLSMS